MRKGARFIVGVLAAIGFLFVLVTFTPINFWWASHLAGAWNDPVGEMLIVPGADAVQGSIGYSSYWRSVYAVRAWKQGGFQTGGSVWWRRQRRSTFYRRTDARFYGRRRNPSGGRSR